MEKITQLIQALNKQEITAVRRYFKVRRENIYTERQKLFDIIVKNKGISDLELLKKLKRRATDPSFSMLKRRLMDDIMKVMVWESNAKTYSSKFHEAKYKCRLMIMEAELLLNRGLQTLAEDILQKAYKLAAFYELSNESILINEQLQSYVGLRKGISSYRFYAENNLANFELIKDKFYAQDYFRKLTMPNLFSTNKELSYKEQSKQAMNDLSKLSSKSQSVQIKYWQLRSEIYYNYVSAEYARARQFANEFIKLVQESPVVYSKDNLGGANMQMAIIEMYLKQYVSAKKYANEAIKNFVSGSLNMLTALDCKYVACLYNKDLAEAANILVSVKQLELYRNNNSIASKWLFYEASHKFLSNKYADALATLQKQTELTEDKSGWRLGYKILEMMCIIELGYYDWLDYRIETFRKLLGELKKENISRPKLIYQVIKTFIKTAYNYKLTTAAHTQNIAQLEKAADTYEWDPRGYEIIRFDKWWSNKIAAQVR